MDCRSIVETPQLACCETGTIRRPSHSRQRQMLGGSPGVAGAIEIERWRGLAALDRPAPLQDNRGKRAREESAHGCGFISISSFSAMKPPEDNERIMIIWRTEIGTSLLRDCGRLSLESTASNGLFGPVCRCIRFEHWYLDTERSGCVADDITRA